MIDFINLTGWNVYKNKVSSSLDKTCFNNLWERSKKHKFDEKYCELGDEGLNMLSGVSSFYL